jgi:GNAT superfamily N-acetyltransferase
MTMPGTWHLATPDLAMLERLLPVARRIFTETFSSLYDEAAFETFCTKVYSSGGSMARDFAAPDVRWRLAIADGAPIGYAKLTTLRAPAIDPAPGSFELQQIYLLSAWHGKGIADQLVEWAVSTADALGASELYLTVFEHNERAKRFYTRHGFGDVGHCTFQLGDRIDEDRIWRRPIHLDGAAH